jgi:hypothetical protein
MKILRHTRAMASSTPTAAPSTKTDQAQQRSPFAGCAIMLILASVALFLISVSAYSLLQQNKEIEKFTSPTPMALSPVSIEEQEAELNALHARLTAFRSQIVDRPDEPAEIALNVTDLNFILATAAPLRDYKPYFLVKEIREGQLIADHYRPMNGMPGSDEKRYLNSIATLKPILAEQTLVFQVEALDVENATVPLEFIAQIPPYRFGLEQQSDALYSPVLSALTSMEAKPNQLILRRIPGQVPSSTVANEQVDSAMQRIIRVLVAGLIFLIGLGVFLSFRAKEKREKAGAA